ncbi:carboxypeptidase regulatory-like domain-containing protein [Candidatus Woesearchaeota archaeon]|nr:carboxypeptidase regulatory-like domain-containing protein [Candidatus Woesearchaeota archaeon]
MNKAILYIFAFLLMFNVAYAIQLPPQITSFSATPEDALTFSSIVATASDFMDNAGLRWIKLYENGTIFETKDCEIRSGCTLIKNVFHRNGTYEYYVVTEDIDNNKATSSTITVNFRGNQPPVLQISQPSVDMNEGDFINFSDYITATDADHNFDELIFQVFTEPFAGSLTYQSDYDDAGTYDVAIRVSDPAGDFDEGIIVVNVNNVINFDVTLDSPLDGAVSTTGDVEFNCSAVSYNFDLDNAVLYIYESGALYANSQPATVSGSSDNASFQVAGINDGNYEWNCLFSDMNGDSAFAPANYTLDVSLPVYDIVWNQTILDLGSAEQGAGALTGNADITAIGDNTNVTVRCMYGNCTEITDDWVDGTDMIDAEVQTITFTCSDTTIGTHWAQFDVTSDEDNLASPDIDVGCNITVPDVTAPSVTLELPADGSTDTDGDVTIQYSVTDDMAASLTCDVYSNTSGTWQIDTTQTVANGGSSTFDYIGLSDGDYLWNVECSDGPNNVFAAADFTFTVSVPDVTAPVVELEAPADGSIDTDGDVTIQYNVTDDMAASLTCDVYSNTSGTWQIDTTQTVANGGWSTYNYLSLADGTYTWNVECSDGSNTAFAADFTFTVSIPQVFVAWNQPTLDLGSGQQGAGDLTGSENITSTGANNNILLTCDSGSCLEITHGPYLTNMADGESQIIYFNCNDSTVGTYSAVFNVTSDEDLIGDQITVGCDITAVPDVTPPVVELESPLDGSTDTDGDVTIQYNVTDDMAATLTCDVYSDTSGSWQADATGQSVANGGWSTYNYLSLADGTYTWNVECNDGSNTAFAAANWSFSVSIPPPTGSITLMNPVDGSTDTDGDVTVEYSVATAIAPQMLCDVYSNTSGTWQADVLGQVVLNQTSSTYDYTTLADADYEWGVTCSDGPALLTSVNWSFSVDTSVVDITAPTVTLELPASGSIDADGNVTVMFNAVDDVDLNLDCDLYSNTSGSWQIDNSWSGVPGLPNGTSTLWYYNYLADGDYEWNLECSDGTNSAFAPANYTFTVDTTVVDSIAPTVTLELPADASTDTDGDITFQFTAVDDIASNMFCQLYSNTTGTWQVDITWPSAANGTSTNVDWNGLSDGTYEWNVQCSDGTNSAFAAANYTFTVSLPDTTAPVISNIQSTSITEQSAVITWGTDEPADSQVAYGIPGDVFMVVDDLTLVLNHNIALAGLQPNTTYHYTVSSRDASGNINQSIEYNFTTSELIKVLINEFEQNPAGTDTGNEWVELYNPNAFAVNISGWEIWEGLASPSVIITVPADTTLNAGSYYIVTGVSNLNNGGEYLTLYDDSALPIDNSSTLIDNDDNDLCQARVPNGVDTDTGADWTFQRCTQGITNDDNENPTVIDVQANPALANQTDPITISANVSDYFGISSVDAFVVWDSTSATISLTDGDSDGVYDNVFTQTSFTGTYTATIIATDVNGNINNTETATFDITTPPGVGSSSTLITAPASGSAYNISDAFTVSANVSASGGDLTDCNATISFTDGSVLSTATATNILGDILDGVIVTSSWNIDAIGTGSSDITVTTTCTSGTSSSDTITNIIVSDVTAPTVTLASPADASTDPDGDVTVQYSVTDDVAVSLTCDVYSNTSGTWQIDAAGQTVASGSSSTFGYVGLSDGTYRWNVECSDGTNAAFAAADFTFTVSIPDVTAPVVSLVSPGDGSTDTDGDVTIQYSVSDDMAASLTCDVYSDTSGSWQADATGQSVANGGSSTYNYPSLADGTYTWNVECNDGSNTAFAAADFTFTVDTTVPDTTAPVVTLESPADGTTDTDGDVTIQYSVSDDMALSLTCNVYSNTGVIWQIDATQIVANGSSSTHTYNGLSNGNYAWNVECSDGSNAAFAAANWGFSVNVPGILNGYILDDSGTGISGATVEVKQGVSVIDSTTSAGDGSYSFTLDEGTYTVLAYTSGYYDNETAGVVVSAGSTTQHDATLQTIITTGDLSGTVSDADNNIYLATVEVKQNGALIDSTTTDENGTYSFSSLNVGNYNVTVWKSGFIDNTALGFAVNVGPNTHDVTLIQNDALAGGISGTIYDISDFSTIEGAEITAYKTGTTDIVQIVYSITDGSYIVNGLPTTDTYDLEASAAGFTTQKFATNIGVGAGSVNTGNDAFMS